MILLIIQQDLIDWANELQNNFNKNDIQLAAFIKIWVNTAINYPRIFHWFPLLGELIETDVSLEKLIPFKKIFLNN